MVNTAMRECFEDFYSAFKVSVTCKDGIEVSSWKHTS